MKRILIIGNSGGGKSTLARRLGGKLGVPVIHLDVLFWKPGWVEREDEEFRTAVARALQQPNWVCDGDFSSSLDLRAPMADTIVWIDQPRWLCLTRVIWRIVKYRHGDRPDMTEGCGETFDLQFYSYIWNWNRTRRARLEAALTTYGGHARLVHLRSDREIAAFLAQA
jgi:adenylate kinase family enzyme